MVMKIRAWLLSLSMTKKVLLASALSLLVLGTGFSAWYFIRLSNTDLLRPDIDFPAGNNADPDVKDVREAFDKNIINFALLGFDRNEERDAEYEYYRPDTIMIVSINLETAKVDLVSIPRDTLVTIYDENGKGILRDKVNSAYGHGWEGADSEDLAEKHRLGMAYQIETISMALKGVPIHYFGTIDMDGVMEAVDILGGVWYDVEKRVYHKTGRVIAEPGYQLLKGKKFMDLLRNRQYSSGDLQRIENQQAILLAAFDQFKQAGKLVHAPQIYMAMKDKIGTNLTFDQIMSLAFFAAKNISMDKFSTHVLETNYAHGRLEESWEISYDYLIIKQKKRAQLIFDVWGIEVKPDPTDVIFPSLDPEPGWDESSHQSGWDENSHRPGDGSVPGETEPGDGGEDPAPIPEEPGDGSTDPIPEPGSETGDSGSGD